MKGVAGTNAAGEVGTATAWNGPAGEVGRCLMDAGKLAGAGDQIRALEGGRDHTVQGPDGGEREAVGEVRRAGKRK